MAGRLLGLVAVLILTGTIGAQLQTPPAQGPEIQRLGVWVGTMQGEVVYKEDPPTPARKVAMTTTCEWAAGNTQVQCRQEALGPSGKSIRQWRMSFDPGSKSYKVLETTSNGQTRELTTTVSGSTWTWTAEDVRDGKPVTLRGTYVVSPASLTSKTEASTDGKTWTVIAEGKATRVK